MRRSFAADAGPRKTRLLFQAGGCLAAAHARQDKELVLDFEGLSRFLST
jgi:hypothetical protein